MKIKHVAEIFSSFQGEGLFVGERQVFVRFAKCNLRCRYCDTGDLASKTVSLDRLVKRINALDKNKICHSVAITGGEPLIHTDGLKSLLPALKRLGYRIYLETNGTLASKLKEVIEFLDYIAMDIKLPSAAGLTKALWAEHRLFLKMANSCFRGKNRGDLFVKAVITAGLRPAEFKKAVGVISGINKNIPLVLQPVTPLGKVREKVKEEEIVRLFKAAKQELRQVLVIPQTHKILGVK